VVSERNLVKETENGFLKSEVSIRFQILKVGKFTSMFSCFRFLIQLEFSVNRFFRKLFHKKNPFRGLTLLFLLRLCVRNI
jgi:hypothetical protein